MTAAEATCKDGGVIIMCSACNDGHGGDDFYKTLKEATDPVKATEEIMKRSRNETIFDQWESQIMFRLLQHFTLIMVTQAPKQMIEDMHMKYAATFEEALAMADDVLAAKGIKNGKITVIPDGVSVIVK
jgi:nickel-dependent lactate racemase